MTNSPVSTLASTWSAEPEGNPENGPGRTTADLDAWRSLRGRMAEIAARRGWSKAEVARRSQLPEGTLSQWFSGKYAGRFDATNAKVADWLEQEEATAGVQAALPVSPDFIDTAASRQLWDMMMSAQILPGMTMASMGAGMGKTTTARRYVEKTANCWLVTVSGQATRPHTILAAVADAVGVASNNPTRLVAAIGKRVERKGAGTLLIFDEAQGLNDEAVNQLRHLLDLYQCGICLLGNDESYGRFNAWNGVEKYAQLRRRFLKRLRRKTPEPGDLVAFIRAWGISDPAMEKFLTGVGMKPGALGQIDQTVKLAKLSIAGTGRELSLADLKAAWAARDVEA